MASEEKKSAPETVEASEQSFIQEKIKKRPINKKKLFMRLLSTVGMAILFGAVACITIICLEPVIGRMANPSDEETPLTEIVFPEIVDEDTPPVNVVINDEPFEDPSGIVPSQSTDEPASADTEPEKTFEEVPIEDMILNDEETVSENEVTVIVNKTEIELDDYQLLYRKMYSLNNEVSKSIVTITEISEDEEGIINNTTGVSVPGIIIGDNGRELLILAYGKSINSKEKITARFCDDKVYNCTLKKRDTNTNMAVYAVKLNQLEDTTKNVYQVAVLGNSNSEILLGSPVLAVGDPMGTGKSLCYGTVTSIDMKLSLPDASVQVLTTDIYGSTNASGFLVNVRGQIVGIICMEYNAQDMKNLIYAYGISGIKRMAEDLSNNIDVNYLGMTVADVSEEAIVSLGVPQGAYITKVEDNSPAMNVGITPGDVITSLNDVRVSGTSDYIQMLYNSEKGEPIKIIINRYSLGSYKEMSLTVEPGLR